MYLLVRVFVSLQGLHDGELGVVFEAGRLVPQNFFQHTQGQSSDGVLGGGRDMSHQSEVLKIWCIYTVYCHSNFVRLSADRFQHCMLISL